jgi:hypothetical protein
LVNETTGISRNVSLLLTAAERTEQRLGAVESTVDDVRKQLEDQRRRIEQLETRPMGSAASTAAGASSAMGDFEVVDSRGHFASARNSRAAGAAGGTAASSANSVYTPNMLIVGGFKARTVREEIRTLTEAAIGGLSATDRLNVLYAFAPYLYGQQALIVLRDGTSPEVMWDLCGKLKRHNGQWKHHGNELWVSRAKTGSALQRAGRLRELQVAVGIAFGKASEPPVETIPITTIPSCARKQCIYYNQEIVAKIDRDSGDIKFNETILLPKGVTGEAILNAMAANREARSWL